MDLLGTKLLHDEGTGVASSDYAHALTKLTEPSLPTASSPIFSSVVYSATQRLEFGYDDVRPISEQELECVLQVCVCLSHHMMATASLCPVYIS